MNKCFREGCESTNAIRIEIGGYGPVGLCSQCLRDFDSWATNCPELPRWREDQAWYDYCLAKVGGGGTVDGGAWHTAIRNRNAALVAFARAVDIWIRTPAADGG